MTILTIYADGGTVRLSMDVPALVRDVRVLEERIQYPLPPRVAERVQSLVREALGLVARTTPDPSPRTVPVPLSSKRRQSLTSEPETLDPADAASVFSEAHRRGRALAGRVYAGLGPAIGPSEVANRLGVTRATVHNWRQAGRLLALHPNGHTYLYPCFQFADDAESDGGVLFGLAQVLNALDRDLSPLGKALWFQTAQPALGGRTPAEVLRDDGQRALGSVLACAAAAYAQGG